MEAGVSRRTLRARRDAEATATYRALATAAVRETWEEANVVLAQSASGGQLQESPSTPDEATPTWLASREAVIAPDTLRPWAHWLTPEVESRRFDTRFLVAQIPPDQNALDLGVESYASLWLSPAEACLDRVQAGEMPMLPPTVDACSNWPSSRASAPFWPRPTPESRNLCFPGAPRRR